MDRSRGCRMTTGRRWGPDPRPSCDTGTRSHCARATRMTPPWVTTSTSPRCSRWAKRAKKRADAPAELAAATRLRADERRRRRHDRHRRRTNSGPRSPSGLPWAQPKSRSRRSASDTQAHVELLADDGRRLMCAGEVTRDDRGHREPSSPHPTRPPPVRARPPSTPARRPDLVRARTRSMCSLRDGRARSCLQSYVCSLPFTMANDSVPDWEGGEEPDEELVRIL